MTLTRTIGSAGALVLVAGLVVGTAGTANAAKVKVIKVTEIETSSSDTIGNDLPEAGDSFSFTSKLLQNGEQVGTDKGKCVLKKIIGPADNPTGAKSRCKVTLKFSQGTIKAAGTFTQSFGELPDVTIAITGGTGRYAGAKGTVRNNQQTEKKSKLTIKYTT